jgi:hypothetical protein
MPRGVAQADNLHTRENHTCEDPKMLTSNFKLICDMTIKSFWISTQ